MCGQRDFDFDKETIEGMKKDYIGKRVRCIEMADDFEPIKSGDEGTIVHIGGGVINVEWDSGRYLGLIINEDRFEIIDENPSTNG